MSIKVEHWGEIPWQLADIRQADYVEEIAGERRAETIIVCTHPPTVTVGKGLALDTFCNATKLPEGIEVHSCSRGGGATYHGTKQVVCYPLINIKTRGKDIGGFLFAMETAIVTTLAYYGIKARGNPMRGNPARTGVWVGDNKIASIGVAIRKWITYHGLAVNLYNDPLAFNGFYPCGLNPSIMTSLEEILGKKAKREDFEAILCQSLIDHINAAALGHRTNTAPVANYSSL